MGCKGMSKRMRGDAGGEGGFAGPEAEAAGHVGVREAATALGEEQGLLARIARQGVPAFIEIAAQGVLGGLADRQQALLLPLAEHPQLLGLEVHRAEVEVDDLLAAQPARVGELQHRPVAQLQRRAGGDPLQQGPHLLGAEDFRQVLGALRAGDQLGRVGAGTAGADEVAVEAADRRQLAGHGRRRGAGTGEAGAVTAHVAVADVAGREAHLPRPLGETAEVDAVGPPRPLGGAARAQVAVVSRQCLFPVHRGFIRPARAASSRRRLTDEYGRAYFDLVVEFFDVGNRHPHAAVGGGAAQRVGLFGAVDAGAFEDRQPAGLDRVRRPRRDRLARQRAGPVGHRHVPDRVFFLFLDRVEAFGRFEPFHADRDGAGLGQLQVLPQPQGEGRAVEGEVGRVLGGDLLLGDLRRDRVDLGLDPVRRVGVEDGGLEAFLQQVVAQLAPVFSGDDFERVAARYDVGVLRFAVDFLGDVADEAVYRRHRVSDVGGDAFVDFAAADVADQTAGQAALLAVFDRFFYRGVDVGADLELLAG